MRLTDFYLIKTGQARTCNRCQYFVNDDCQKSVAVQARHGKEALEKWTENPDNVNGCNYFAAVDTSDKRKDGWEYGYHNNGSIYGGSAIS